MIDRIISNSEAFGNLDKKKSFFLKKIKELFKHHNKKCPQIKNFLDKNNINIDKIKDIEKIPYLPVKIFKELDLKSIKNDEVFKVLKSSGTSGNLSKIFLDKKNSLNQTKVLNKIITYLFGKKRMPMLIVDSKEVFSDRNNFSARAAAILGFSFMGRDHTYLLNNDFSFNYKIYENFKRKYFNQKFLIFGLTHLIWEKLLNNKNLKNENFTNSILLHGGGWKKLNELRISNTKFNKKLFQKFNLKKIHNYYGMVEQTGSIFLECEKCNSFITSNYSDILIRGKKFEILDSHKEGFIQLISLIPTSYPGNSILSDDLGMIVENDCTCKKLGKRFKVNGRILNSEIRGCSNV
tara:strand:+ start:303 stop:1352 length:1050 start_codon:yes stop_codon:yes gene_type:complete